MGGNIISILATWVWTGSAFTVPSAMSKSGIHAMTQSLATEWGKTGIRINAIAPGPYPSAMLGSAVNSDYSEIEKNNPRKRVGTPEDIAGLTIFLCSRAGAYTVGETITSDGGIVKTTTVASAFIQAYDNNVIDLPVFARMMGSESDKAKDIYINLIEKLNIVNDITKAGGKNPLRNQYDLISIIFNKDDFEDANNFAREFISCKRIDKLTEKYNEKEVNYIGKRILSDLPNDLHEELLNKDAGQTLDIREIGENINLILICDRKDDVGLQVSREAIEDNIYSQKIGMMSRRYLRDLRRDAVIEYR